MHETGCIAEASIHFFILVMAAVMRNVSDYLWSFFAGRALIVSQRINGNTTTPKILLKTIHHLYFAVLFRGLHSDCSQTLKMESFAETVNDIQP